MPPGASFCPLEGTWAGPNSSETAARLTVCQRHQRDSHLAGRPQTSMRTVRTASRACFCDQLVNGPIQARSCLCLTTQGCTFLGVPVVAQQVKEPNIASVRMWVPSLASLSGLRIRHCHKLQRRSPRWLGPGIAVAVV